MRRNYEHLPFIQSHVSKLNMKQPQILQSRCTCVFKIYKRRVTEFSWRGGTVLCLCEIIFKGSEI